MEAIILAGGFGTRLQSVVKDLPKPMAPVSGRPLLAILLDLMNRNGIKRVILSVGYLSEKISSYFGNQYKSIEIVYSIEESPLGTGGAIRLALSNCKSDIALILNGDTYLEADFQKIKSLWEARHNPIIVAREVPDVSRYGRMILKDGKVIAFQEKGENGLGFINAGCYLFPKELLNTFEIYKPFSLEKDFLVDAVGNRPFDCFITEGRFIDIGIPEDYARAEVELLG